MASLESLLTRSYAAQSVSGMVTDDKAIALEIVHTSSDAITSVTVTSATQIELIDAAGTNTLDFATYSNLGLLVDALNATANWKARILDGLRATSTTNSMLIPNSAVTAVSIHGETVYRVYIDTTAVDAVFYRVSMDRGVLNTDLGQVRADTEKILKNHRVKITGIKYNQDISAAELGAVRIYECDPRNASETLIWAAKSVDATTTTHDFTLNPITAREGNDLVVVVLDSTSIDDAAANFLQVDYVRE